MLASAEAIMDEAPRIAAVTETSNDESMPSLSFQRCRILSQP